MNDESKWRVWVILGWLAVILIQALTMFYVLDIKKFFEVIE